MRNGGSAVRVQRLMRANRAAGILLVLVVAGCGGTTDEGGDVAATQSRLDITVDPGDGATPAAWTLTCDPAGGSHPAAKEACAALTAVADPFAPVPKDMGCTEIYGGPQTATIRGTWQGREVDASFRRTNGCEIARWDRLAAVFGTEPGVGKQEKL